MKGISKRDLNLILMLLGIMAIVLTYFMIFSKWEEETAAMQAQYSALVPQRDALLEHERKIPEYNAAIAEAELLVAEELEHYAPIVRVEDMIMYAIDLETRFNMAIPNLSFSDAVTLRDFAVMRGGEEVTYSAKSASMSFPCTVTYENLKKAIDYIYATPYRTQLNSLSVTFDNNLGGLSANMSVTKIFIDDGSGAATDADVPQYPLGNENPFNTVIFAEE